MLHVLMDLNFRTSGPFDTNRAPSPFYDARGRGGRVNAAADFAEFLRDGGPLGPLSRTRNDNFARVAANGFLKPLRKRKPSNGGVF
jgi:hypothetical protein